MLPTEPGMVPLKFPCLAEWVCPLDRVAGFHVYLLAIFSNFYISFQAHHAFPPDGIYTYAVVWGLTLTGTPRATDSLTGLRLLFPFGGSPSKGRA